jgi:hypothetical protein
MCGLANTISPVPPIEKAVQQTKGRGRRLRTPANVRALIASQIRAVEGDPTLTTAVRARLLAQLSARLLEAIALADGYKEVQRRLDELIRERERKP